MSLFVGVLECQDFSRWKCRSKYITPCACRVMHSTVETTTTKLKINTRAESWGGAFLEDHFFLTHKSLSGATLWTRPRKCSPGRTQVCYKDT